MSTAERAFARLRIMQILARLRGTRTVGVTFHADGQVDVHTEGPGCKCHGTPTSEGEAT